jgi:hypothetical protein
MERSKLASESRFFDLVSTTLRNVSTVPQLFIDFMGEEAKGLQSLANDLCIPESPGFPGTLFSAVFQLKIMMADLGLHFQGFSASLISAADEAHATAEGIRGDRKALIDSDTQLPWSAAIDLIGLSASLNAAPSIPAKDGRKVVEQIWGKYCETLMVCRANIARSKQKSGELAKVPPLLTVAKSIGTLGERIAEAGQAVRLLTSRIEYCTDFVAFTKRAELKFIDVSPPPFTRFKFKSKFCAPEIFVIEPFTMQYLPSHIAIAKADFVPESRHELRLKRGDLVYLMQPPREEWVLAMSRTYAVYGWVPTDFVEVQGSGVAVVLDVKGARGFRGRPRSLLAIVGEQERGKIPCQDSRGNLFEFDREAIAVL